MTPNARVIRMKRVEISRFSGLDISELVLILDSRGNLELAFSFHFSSVDD